MKSVGPPPFESVEWEGMSRVAAPVIGLVVLLWHGIEIQMNETIMAIKARRKALLGERYSHDLPRRFEDRLAEWATLALEPIGRASDDPSIQGQLLKLRAFRNLMAEGIIGLTVEEDGALIMATEQRLTFTRVSDQTLHPARDVAPPIMQYSVYGKDDLLAFEEALSKTVMMMREVRDARMNVAET